MREFSTIFVAMILAVSLLHGCGGDNEDVGTIEDVVQVSGSDTDPVTQSDDVGPEAEGCGTDSDCMSPGICMSGMIVGVTAGVCDTDSGECHFVEIVPPVDCGASGQVCFDGVCVDCGSGVGVPECAEDEYNPCDGKDCGEQCTICMPAALNCVEPEEDTYCNQGGDCLPLGWGVPCEATTSEACFTEEGSYFGCELPWGCDDVVFEGGVDLEGNLSPLTVNVEAAHCYLQKLREDEVVRIRAVDCGGEGCGLGGNVRVWVLGDGTAILQRTYQAGDEIYAARRFDIVDDATLDACLASSDPAVLKECIFGWYLGCYPEGAICPILAEETSYDACKEMACGDTCSVCAPNTPDCVEPNLLTYCDQSGGCLPDGWGIPCQNALAEGCFDEEGPHFDCSFPWGCEKVIFTGGVDGEGNLKPPSVNVDAAHCFLQKLLDKEMVRLSVKECGSGGCGSDDDVLPWETFVTYNTDKVWVFGDGTAVLQKFEWEEGAEYAPRRFDVMDDASLNACLASSNPVVLKACIFGWPLGCYSEDPTCPDLGGWYAWSACEGKACGDPCKTCAPDDLDCDEPDIFTYCDKVGECLPSNWGVPCEDVSLGECFTEDGPYFECSLPWACETVLFTGGLDEEGLPLPQEVNVDAAHCFLQKLRDDEVVYMTANDCGTQCCGGGLLVPWEPFVTMDTHNVWVRGDGTAILKRNFWDNGEEYVARRFDIIDDAILDVCLASSDPVTLKSCIFGWYLGCYPEDPICPDSDG